MRRGFQQALFAGAALALAQFCVSSAASAQAPHTLPPERDGVWAQSYSDLPADPGIRFGTLKNGMRYAIMANATPSHQASLRLWIGSGSLEETDAEQGLAHFLEHMAFRGSTHVPNGDMIKILERHGLAFGPDTNAETGFDNTIYQLDLPQADKDSLDTGLMLMRDIASELQLDPKAIEPERGVVLSEERLRDTSDFEASAKQRLAFEFKGQLVANRLPIGKVEVIKTAPASLIRAYYQANYRPDRAALVAVGDFDPDAMEAAIKAQFSNWAPKGPPAAQPDYGRPIQTGPRTQLYVHAGVTPSMSLAWLRPYDPAADTLAREERDMIRSVAFAVLNRRFERLAHQADAPFLSANSGRSASELHSADVTSLQVVFRPPAWREALTAAIAAQRQALTFGVSQAEVDREVTELRVKYRTALGGAATRRTPDLANLIVFNINGDGVVTSPAQDLSTFEQAVKGLTAAEVTDVLKDSFQGSGPLLSLATSEPITGGEAAVAAAFAAAEQAPLAAATDHKAKIWTHTNFGPMGRVVERKEIADLGVTFVRFANGVRLTLKPTAFRKDQTYVAVRFNHGRLSLPPASPTGIWLMQAFVQAGLTDIAYDDLQQVLADKSASIALGVNDADFSLTGATRPQDLLSQMQLLAAYMTAPGWRPEAFDQLRSGLLVALSRLSSTPQGVAARDLGQLEHGGDARWRVPSPAEVKTQPLAAFKTRLEHALTTGPLEVEVVGDMNIDQAIADVASTFGALPPRPEDKIARGEDQVQFPPAAPTPIVRTHDGRADQALAYIAWPIPDLFSDPQRARTLSLTAEVLGSRLLDQIRMKEGATYSPNARSVASETFPGYGFAYAMVETQPTKLAGFYDTVSRIATAMATEGVTADELERARKPHVEALIKAQQTNEFWLERLEGAQTDPRRLTLIREMIPGYGKVTAKDIQNAANTYFTDAHAWRFEVTPAAAQPKT